jgi:hypothetical protein
VNRIRLPLPLLFLIAACGGSVDFHPSAPPPHPVTAKTADAVEVLSTPAPDRPAVAIGTLEGTSSTHAPTSDGREDVLARLRSAAGERGCDAIALSAIEQKLAATSNGTPLYRAHQSATCFVYR